jgi:CubicO group peptidase (beta-lactamase class C family)
LLGVVQIADRPVITGEHRRQMTTDQVPAGAKTAESFFPGFWDAMGWGFGVGVQTHGPRIGRYGWSGGQGTDFFIDPDGTIGILLTQVELGRRMTPLLEDFQTLHPPSP